MVFVRKNELGCVTIVFAAQDLLLRVSRGGLSGKLLLVSIPQLTALMESLDFLCAAGFQDPVCMCRAWLLLRGVRCERGVR